MSAHGAFGERLKPRVQRRAHDQVPLAGARQFADLIGDPVGEKARPGTAAPCQRKAVLFGGIGLGAGDEPGLDHVVQHLVGAPGRGDRVARRVQPARGPDQPGNNGALEQRQLRRRLAEIALRRRIDAVSPGAEIDAVQVDFEDLVLRETVLEPQRQQHLADLAREIPIRAQKHDLGELLRDRAAALENLAGPEIRHRRAQDANWVDAEMAVEPAILGRDDGLRQIGRHLAQR